MKNKLAMKEINGELTPVVSSRIISEDFGKRHSDVLSKIEDKLTNGKIRSLNYFIESEYVDAKGEKRKEYLLTEQGFSFIVMGFTGKKADEFKLNYICEFEQMKQQLKAIATQSPLTFIESLSLTEYSIEKYLPKFLNWKNVDEIIPALVERVSKSVENGSIKIGVLNSTINVAKQVREACETSAQKEIMTTYIDQAQAKYDKVLIAKMGGTSNKVRLLEEKIESLSKERYDSDDYWAYIDSVANTAEYQMLSKSFRDYVSYIAKKDYNNNYRAVHKELYKEYQLSYKENLSVIKKEGNHSKIETLYAIDPIYLKRLVKLAGQWAFAQGYTLDYQVE